MVDAAAFVVRLSAQVDHERSVRYDLAATLHITAALVHSHSLMHMCVCVCVCTFVIKAHISHSHPFARRECALCVFFVCVLFVVCSFRVLLKYISYIFRAWHMRKYAQSARTEDNARELNRHTHIHKRASTITTRNVHNAYTCCVCVCRAHIYAVIFVGLVCVVVVCVCVCLLYAFSIL